jgi:hypothetical protein
MLEWIYFEKLDNWHLVDAVDITGEDTETPFLTYVTWCGLRIDDKAPRKAAPDGWSDALHDDCYRRSREA